MNSKRLLAASSQRRGLLVPDWLRTDLSQGTGFRCNNCLLLQCILWLSLNEFQLLFWKQRVKEFLRKAPENKPQHTLLALDNLFCRTVVSFVNINNSIKQKGLGNLKYNCYFWWYAQAWTCKCGKETEQFCYWNIAFGRNNLETLAWDVLTMQPPSKNMPGYTLQFL